ncbi:hypothetical protein Pylas_096 [Klebsiella phage Pylas]|uniref:Uncharacterized protein n=1 Tax=Klebsiella phage Pylas TaxID=2419682 RepID=A0A3G3BYP3_9CAUD|nr:hypothetical protein HYP73_gp88 [Klebsiella phage Pylas]AYP69344.1 hypothetical protein Pylas_096 [Klebsiella phage Pylas]
MIVLPAIGTTVNLKERDKLTPVNIVAHYEHKAIYAIGSGLQMETGWGYAINFEEIKPTSDKQPQDKCEPGNHNYVQIAEAHENSAFCTRCGNTIKL